MVRAGNPRPGAWLLADGKRVKVLRAHPVPGDPPPGPTPHELRWPGATVATAAGRLVLDEVQPEGRRPMPADAWLAGSGAPRGRGRAIS